MKKIKSKIVIVALLGLVAVAFVGCGKKAPEQYGEAVTSTEVTPIKDILANPESFADKKVAIEGEITAVCPSGCWFDVKSNGLEMHVDIKPSGFVIPQKSGSKVKTEGKVEIEDNKVTFIGTGVEIK